MTNLVLFAAVIVLTLALVQQSRRSQHVSREVPDGAEAPQAAPVTASLSRDLDFVAGDLPMETLAAWDDETSEALAFVDHPLPGGVDTRPRQSPGARGPVEASPLQDDDNQPRMRGGNREHAREGAGDRSRPHRPLGPQELATRCLEVAREIDPELGQRLTEALQKNPAEFERAMRQGGFGRRMYAMAELKNRDPELYRAKVSELSQAMQIERTAKKWREAKRSGSVGDADAYEAQLRSLLQVQFAMTVKARGDMLCRLEDRISELRDEIARDAANFNHLLDLRMQALAAEPAARNGAAANEQPASDSNAPPASAEPGATHG
jgi:hypothetical protein